MARLPDVVPIAGGGRLGGVLERWRPSLVAGLASAFAAAEPDLRAWMPFAAEEQEDAGAFVAWCVEAFDAGRSFAYAVTVEAGVVGYINVTPERDASAASMGYWLRPEARGRGLATAVVRTLASEALSSLPSLTRVTADVDERNVASQRVLERAGFVLSERRPRPARTRVQSEVELVFVLERAGGRGAVEG